MKTFISLMHFAVYCYISLLYEYCLINSLKYDFIALNCKNVKITLTWEGKFNYRGRGLWRQRNIKNYWYVLGINTKDDRKNRKCLKTSLNERRDAPNASKCSTSICIGNESLPTHNLTYISELQLIAVNPRKIK